MSIIKNAIISSVQIETCDRAKLTAWINLDYGGSGQSFGGYSLYVDLKDEANVAGHFIYKCLEVVGVEKWDELKGNAIRVELDKPGLGGLITWIGHITKEVWFRPAIDFKNL